MREDVERAVVVNGAIMRVKRRMLSIDMILACC